MSDDVTVYDASNVTVSFAAAILDSGWDDGEFCKIERDNDKFTARPGTDGSVTRSRREDKLEKVTIILGQTSDGNSKLSAIHNLDVSSPNGAGIAPLVVRDKSGTALFMASKAWIIGPPKTVSFGREASARAWELHAIMDTRFDGGSPSIG